MAHRTRVVVVLLLGAFALVTPAPRLADGAARAAASPAKDPADALMKKMLTALKANLFDDYVADGTPKLKTMPKGSFALVSAHFGPMLAKGYKTTYLTTLNKPDATLHLWKLQAHDEPEEFLVKIVLKDGKVDSFSLM